MNKVVSPSGRCGSNVKLSHFFIFKVVSDSGRGGSDVKLRQLHKFKVVSPSGIYVDVNLSQ